MENFVNMAVSGSEEISRLPIIPRSFGSGAKFSCADDCHLLFAVKRGTLMLCAPDGEKTLGEGSLVFLRSGTEPGFLRASEDFECEFVLFLASEEFLSHLQLPDIAVGETGEGAGISSVVRMSPYALEYYHDALKICAAVYGALAKVARDLMILRMERFECLSERLSPAILQIEQRYDEALTVRMLAYSCAMSESQFGRCFKRAYGCTPIQYLIRIRLAAAKELIANSDIDFEEVARRTGFGSAKYFGDVLKRVEHITPRELRSMYRDTTQICFF